MPTTNPVPSTDPTDLLFNAGKLDEVVNGAANSFTDRLGATRRTVAGMNADFDAQLADAESDLNVYRSDAAASAAEALGYLQTIRATSYGAYASDPATDPLGNPPTVGDEYFNTTANLLKRWNGTIWQASDINTANLAAPSGSSLVGYDGGTVQDVLDGSKSLQDYAALRAYTGRAKRVYITGLLATAKPAGIAGIFQYDSTDTTSTDNGGTVVVGADGRRWKRQFDGDVSILWFGADGYGIIDSTTSVQNAINSGYAAYAPKPAVGYKITGTISIVAGQKLIGIGARPTFLAAHTGAVFQLTETGHLENVFIKQESAPFLFNFTGVLVGGATQYNTKGTVRNVFVSSPATGIEVRGGCYFYDIVDVDVYNYKNYGILLSPATFGGVTSSPNNNYIRFKTLASNTQAPYNWSLVTWEQAAIKVSGSQNYFVGGEPAIGKYGVIIEENATMNRFVSMYLELNYCPIKASKNSYTIWDSSAPDGIIDIDANAIVRGPSGDDVARYTSLLQKPISAAKDAKGIWFFDEGFGSTTFDRSGGSNNLTLTSPIWDSNGRWGSGLALDVDRTHYINPITLASVDWTQPFTIAMCYKAEDVAGKARQAILSFSSGARYAAIARAAGDTYWQYYDYDGTTVTSISIPKVKPSAHDGFSWLIIYFDPVNKTLSNIDPFFGLTDNVSDADAPRFAPWVTGGGGGITKVQIMQDHFNQQMQGYVSFFGIWQRKLTLPEASHLVNMRTPHLLPTGASARAAAQADSTAADVAGLKSDFNALLAKFRAVGMMKT